MNGDDTVDIGETLRALRVEWRRIALGTALGLLGGLGVLVLAPKRWQGRATVLVREARNLPGSIAQLIGGAGGQLASSLLGGGVNATLETDMALMRSRHLAGEVVDSLRLQVAVRSPEGTPAWQLVRAVHTPGRFKPVKLDVATNAPDSLPVGTGYLLLAPARAREATIRVYDREDAISRFVERLAVDEEGGEVVSVAWRGDDSLSGAAAPNLLAQRYLSLRRATDRTRNGERFAFVSRQADSLERNLTDVSRRLRNFQDRSGVLDLTLNGRIALEAASRLQEQLETLVVEERALTHLMERIGTGALAPRQLAAYPTFLKSPAINDFLAQIARLETERVALLQTRGAADPAVIARAEGVKQLELQLQPLARTYADAVARQHATLQLAADSVQRVMRALPAQAEEAYALQLERERLAKTALAVQAQKVELQLNTIGEGGEARQVDMAEPLRKATFPPRVMTLVLGAVAGLAFGLVLALVAVSTGPVRNADDVRRTSSARASDWRTGAPVVVTLEPNVSMLVVAPVSAGIDGTAIATAATETARMRAQVVEIRTVPSLHSMPMAALVSADHPVLLVARAGVTTRAEIRDAVRWLADAQVPCAGVVVAGEGV
jgi:uncharacterized protein involved in exopolysaccharide biosynthesis